MAENGTSNWVYWADASLGYMATFQTTTTEVYSGTQSGQLTVQTVASPSSFTKVMIKNANFSLEGGKSYLISFYLKTDIPDQAFRMQVHQDASPYTVYHEETLNSSTAWQAFSFDFIAPVTTSDVRWTLKLGNSVATYYIDEVSITENSLTYTSLIDPNYSIDWSQVGIPGGIPDIPNVLNVLDFGATDNGVLDDDYAAFQAALDAANYGEAVFIPSGEYYIQNTLQMPEGVVLRGECPTVTILNFDLAGVAETLIDIATYEYGTFVDVTGTLDKGTTMLSVVDPSNFTIGGYAELQQDNDAAIMYTDPIYNTSWAEHSVGQLFKIIGISGNEIQLDRPLFLNYNPTLNPQLRPIGLIEEVGIENLKINRLDNGDDHTILLKNAVHCWVRNIESDMTVRAHIQVSRALDSEIKACYLHHSHDYGGGGHGYGVDVTHHSTSNLIEDNIFEHLRHSMLIQLGATGNVFGYNYSIDPFWSTSATNPPPDISMHGHYPTMNLFEGNIVQEATFSDYWGPVGPGNTMFRNRVASSEIRVADQSHYQNVIANEITDGVSTLVIETDVENTWYHSNNMNGYTINTTTASLPASLYLSEKPDFFYQFAYPSIGPEFTLGSGTIPAEERYLAGELMQLCHCNPEGYPCYPEDSLQIDLRVWLEGPFTSDSMRTLLNTRELLPGYPNQVGGHPYTVAPWNYIGLEGTTFNAYDYAHIHRLYDSPVVDWILLSFRSEPTSVTPLAQSAALLLGDGRIIIPQTNEFWASLPSSFYVLASHHNHLTVMTKLPLAFSGTSLSYNFRTAGSYENQGSKEMSANNWVMRGGNGDRLSDLFGEDINSYDNLYFQQHNGFFNVYLPADYTLDGDVNAEDKLLWEENNGVFSTLRR